MAELIFGICWTLFMAFFTFMFYGNTGGTIIVNGEQVTQEVFNSMLGPKLFIGIFWAIGIFVIFHALKKMVVNVATDKYGEDCYGIIREIYPTGTIINGKREYKADIAIYIPSEGDVKILSEIVEDKYEYPVKSCLSCKYYKGDINIIDTVDSSYIPFQLEEELQKIKEIQKSENNIFEQDNEDDEDIVFLHGQKYKKLDD